MTQTFNDIVNPELRAWNRCAMVFNLAKDHSPKQAAKYASQFPEHERNELTGMYNRIISDGYETTRAAVNRNVVNG